MSFRDDIRQFNVEVDTKSTAVFVRTVELIRDSIVEGSSLTGAPGQPVGQYGPGYHPGKVGGYLKASYQTEFDGNRSAEIATDAPYAEAIEDGAGQYGPLHLRSTVGGFNSVKQTVAAFPRIVEKALSEVSR